MFTQVPEIDLSKCEYVKSKRELRLVSEFFGMPPRFRVRSQYTGKVIEFVAVQPGDPLYDDDGWDGEMCVYRPVTDVPNVKSMYIYNQY